MTRKSSVRYEVIADVMPVLDGGFRSGVRFGVCEMNTMLDMWCLGEGVVLYDLERRRKLRVVRRRNRLGDFKLGLEAIR